MFKTIIPNFTVVTPEMNVNESSSAPDPQSVRENLSMW